MSLAISYVKIAKLSQKWFQEDLIVDSLEIMGAFWGR